jgi:hypothetical protein
MGGDIAEGFRNEKRYPVLALKKQRALDTVCPTRVLIINNHRNVMVAAGKDGLARGQQGCPFIIGAGSLFGDLFLGGISGFCRATPLDFTGLLGGHKRATGTRILGGSGLGGTTFTSGLQRGG